MFRSLWAAISCALLAVSFTGLAPLSAAAQATKGKDKITPPEDVKFETDDGWTIHATYYAGKLKKNAVPFILLHGWEGQRGDYESLAKFLQSLGHAVLCPDLRGHGQ